MSKMVISLEADFHTWTSWSQTKKQVKELANFVIPCTTVLHNLRECWSTLGHTIFIFCITIPNSVSRKFIIERQLNSTVVGQVPASQAITIPCLIAKA